MLAWLHSFSQRRSAWLLLFISALAFELTALYFQYGMGLQPCVFCVYERLAMAGLIFSGLVGLIGAKNGLLRLLALLIGLFSAGKGLAVALRHASLQMYPAPWKQCEFFPNFPETLPLHQWFPLIFNPTGTCNESQWSLFGVTMVQWLVFIFAVYVVVLILLALSQLKRSKTPRRLFR